MSYQASTDSLSRFDGIIFIIAILLIAAPFLLGYSGDHDATAMSVVTGLFICGCVMCSLSDQTYREIDFGLGVLTAAVPLLHAGSDGRAIFAHMIVGGAVALISSGELLFPKHQPQQAHAFWQYWDDKQ